MVRNGYTDTAASSGTSLYLKAGENASDIKTILASRSNLIEKRAVIALIKSEGRTEFWSVQFLFTDDRKVKDGYDLGKEVRISLDGSKVWMNPKPIPVWASRAYGDCVVEDSLF